MSDTQRKVSAVDDSKWVDLVKQQVGSLRYGVVEIIVHDSRVIQIEKTEPSVVRHLKQSVFGFECDLLELLKLVTYDTNSNTIWFLKRNRHIGNVVKHMHNRDQVNIHIRYIKTSFQVINSTHASSVYLFSCCRDRYKTFMKIRK